MTGTFPLALPDPVVPFNYDAVRHRPISMMVVRVDLSILHARYLVEMMGKFHTWEIFRDLREAVHVGELSRGEGSQ